MDGELSMGARVEITKKYATAYRRAAKKDKGQILGQVCAVTGWSRDNARRRLTDAGRAGTKVVMMDRRQRRPAKYSLQARGVLERVWAVSSGQCGKCLAVLLPTLLDALETHGELVPGCRGYSPEVRVELEAMSAATIDRYLAPARATDQLRGISATKAGALLRSSITIRKAGDEVEAEPGFFEGDTVAHCGPTLRGEFARTLKPTGWGQDRNGRRRRIYDVPATPLDRLLTAGVLAPAQKAELLNRRDRLNPAELARDIHRYQAKLTGLAKDKTDRLRATLPSALPHPRGIKVS